MFLVQSAKVLQGTGDATAYILDTPVPIGKSFVIGQIQGTQTSSHSAWPRLQDGLFYLSGASGGNYTTITIDPYNSGTGFSYQVITGDSFIVQEGSTTIVDPATSVTVTPGVFDPAISFLLLYASSSSASVAPLGITGRISGTDLIFEKSVVDPWAGDSTIHWALVEWSGATVQRGSISPPSSNNVTISLPDATKAFAIGHTSIYSSNANKPAVRLDLQTNNLQITTSSTGLETLDWQVISHPDLNVTQYNITGTGDVDGKISTTIPSVTNIDKTFLPAGYAGNALGSGGSNTTISANCVQHLSGPTTLDTYKHYSFPSTDTTVYVAEYDEVAGTIINAELSLSQSISNFSWDTLKNVYINTTASDVGREVHPWVTWSDTEVVLGPITKTGLSGNTFYFKIVDNSLLESDWYGPITIEENEISASISLSSAISSDIIKYLITNNILNVSSLVDIDTSAAKSIQSILNLYNSLNIDEVTRSLSTTALLQLSQIENIVVDSWDLFKKVYINSVQSDTGQKLHSFVSWSDTEIVLAPINKQSISGNTFYFKVENTEGISSWYGPVLIGEVYNELITLLTNPSILSTGQSPSATIVNAILNIGQLVGANITGHELGAALLNISQNISLDVDTQAVLNAAIFLLQSGTISPEDFGSVINAVLSFDTSQTTVTSQYEPPAVHKVKFIRLKLKP